MTTRRETRARKALWDRIAYHGVGIGVCFFFLAPFVIMLISSFRPNSARR